MKQTFSLIATLLPTLLLSQHILTIQGRVTDESLGIYVSHPKINLVSTRGTEWTAVGDSLGWFSISAAILSDTLSAFIEVSAKNQMKISRELHIRLERDTVISINIQLPPKIVCYDSFLPSPLFFEFNSTVIKDPELDSALSYFFSKDNNEFLEEALIHKSVLKISCVRGFHEVRGTA